jgi:hypothetical protein
VRYVLVLAWWVDYVRRRHPVAVAVVLTAAVLLAWYYLVPS